MATAFSKRPGKIKQLTLSLAALLVITFSFSPIAVADETPLTDTAPTAPAETTPTDPTPATTETTTPPPTEPSPPPTDVQGPTSPTGAESDTYTYNADTGLWENSKYTWDPVTKQTAPKTAPTYSYNPETGHWDTTEWVYDAPTGKYVPNIISVLSLPEGALVSESSPTPSLAKAASLTPATSLQSNSNTGPGSTNTITDPVKPKGLFDLFYNAFISNDINSSAISGDALVNMNTLAGSALSGDARAIATIFNLLQSSWNLGLVGNAFHAFTESIFGNVIGDLLLDPGYSPSAPSATNPSDITINSSGNTAIDNTITLEATSGDASVTNNTKAGDATSGNATVIANIINAINSSIISGQSFVGMLNIYGNLNGDILLPQNLITSLLASNAIGTLDTSQITNSEIIGNFDNNSTITNTVNADASSGNATVDKNTSAGNATSGSANTNVTLLNLTGRKVIGKNALLVFVNVMGKWVGMIVDAPAGSTSAALGSGITENSSLAINDTDNKTINNTINVDATSGDATVSNNTSAGNATSGDANAAVNILNLNNSQFALSDWFGVLFINVFGTWTGSFGIDTPAGTIPLNTPSTLTGASGASPMSAQAIRAFRFTPHSDGTYTLDKSDDGVAALTQAGVLGARTTPASNPAPAHEATSKPAKGDWLMTAIGVSIAFSLLGTERILNRRAASN